MRFVVLMAIVVGCAQVSYREVAREPLFEVPDLEAMQARIAAIDAEKEKQRREFAPLIKKADGTQKAKLRQELDGKLKKLDTERAALVQAKQAAQEVVANVEETNQKIRKHNERADEIARGLRYYRTSPYLLVYSDGQDGIVWEIHHLPDPSKKLSAKPSNFLSSLTLKMVFDDHGRLSDADVTGDSTAVPKAIVKAVETIAPSLLKALMSDVAKADEHTLPAPHLYKIVQEGGRVRFLGGKRDLEHIKITVRPEAKKKEGS